MNIMEIIQKRRSIRSYKKEPIAEGILQKLLKAAQLAPSSRNKQAWKLVVVRDAEMRKKIDDACMQNFIGDAPVILAVCTTSSNDPSVIIAVDHITLVAASEGLGSCWIYSFDRNKVKELLGVPDEASVVCLLPVGYPAVDPEMPERKPLEELVAYEKY